MAIKTYKVNDFWLDIDKENHVDIESTDGVITSVKNNGEDIGGGGSSDFSTAEVEVINTTADMVSVSAFSINDTPSSAIMPFGTIMADSDRTYTAPLYKGVCAWEINKARHMVAVTGDISYDDDDGIIFITGDGAITIS